MTLCQAEHALSTGSLIPPAWTCHDASCPRMGATCSVVKVVRYTRRCYQCEVDCKAGLELFVKVQRGCTRHTFSIRDSGREMAAADV